MSTIESRTFLTCMALVDLSETKIDLFGCIRLQSNTMGGPLAICQLISFGFLRTFALLLHKPHL